jgi:hypothetical protein
VFTLGWTQTSASKTLFWSGNSQHGVWHSGESHTIIKEAADRQSCILGAEYTEVKVDHYTSGGSLPAVVISTATLRLRTLRASGVFPMNLGSWLELWTGGAASRRAGATPTMNDAAAALGDATLGAT